MTRPDLGASSPLTTLNSVVLPAPLGPMSPVTPPVGTEMDTSLSTWAPPKAMHTSDTSRAGIGHSFDRRHAADRHRRRCGGGAPAPLGGGGAGAAQRGR